LFRAVHPKFKKQYVILCYQFVSKCIHLFDIVSTRVKVSRKWFYIKHWFSLTIIETFSDRQNSMTAAKVLAVSLCFLSVCQFLNHCWRLGVFKSVKIGAGHQLKLGKIHHDRDSGWVLNIGFNNNFNRVSFDLCINSTTT
jgi:hypothetical protein